MICDRCKIQYNHREGFSSNCPNCGWWEYVPESRLHLKKPIENFDVDKFCTNEPPQKTENEKIIETLQGVLTCYRYINKQLKELGETKEKTIIELRELVFAKTEEIKTLQKALYEANNRT